MGGFVFLFPNIFCINIFLCKFAHNFITIKTMKKIFLLIISIVVFGVVCNAQPTLTISAVDSISTFKARLNANISDFGGWTVNGKGFFVSKTANFADAVKITSVAGTANTNTKLGDFYYYPGTTPTASSKPYFEPGTTYYVKAFAKKGSGSTADTVFTSVVSFTTLPAQGGICAVDSVAHITYTTAVVYGRAVNVNDAWKIAKAGIVIGTQPNPTVANGIVFTSTTSTSSLPKSYSVGLTDLFQGVTYYARAWVANQYTNTYYDTTYSDQISFTTLCAVDSVPSNVTFDSIGITSLRVNWTPREGQYYFDVDYGFVGHQAGEGTIVACEGNNLTLNNLEGGRSYSVYVRARCVTGAVGEWSPVRTVTTLPSLCANVSSIHTEELTHSFAKIEWTPGSMSQSVWEVMFAKSNEAYPATPYTIYSNPVFSPIGLNPSTQYKVKIRANCDPYYSDWSSEFKFTTLVMGLEDVEENVSKINIYPNPSKGNLKFDVQNLQVNQIDVYNSYGVNVFSSKEIPQELEIKDKGIYFIIINTDKGIQTEKVVIN